MTLKEAQDAILHDQSLAPSGAVTHCNQGARRVAQAIGCSEFDDQNATADIMYSIMDRNVSGSWRKVTGPQAVAHACTGGLAFAALPSNKLGESHGHIASVAPMALQFSGSLKKDVPVLANIGKTNGYLKSSAVFPVAKGEPDYFAWS